MGVYVVSETGHITVTDEDYHILVKAVRQSGLRSKKRRHIEKRMKKLIHQAIRDYIKDHEDA